MSSEDSPSKLEPWSPSTPLSPDRPAFVPSMFGAAAGGYVTEGFMAPGGGFAPAATGVMLSPDGMPPPPPMGIPAHGGSWMSIPPGLPYSLGGAPWRPPEPQCPAQPWLGTDDRPPAAQSTMGTSTMPWRPRALRFTMTSRRVGSRCLCCSSYRRCCSRRLRGW
jgi:hypothetical protein